MAGQQRQSHSALAARLVEKHKGEFRYVLKWDRWFHWTGQRWEHDWGNAAIMRAAAAVIRRARQLDDLEPVMAVVRLAETLPEIRVEPEVWDQDPWLLNTPAGTIDLRTGQNLGHRAEDLITRMTRVVPAGECPRFRAFFRWLFQYDLDRGLSQFMARWLGYCLTGLTREQAWVMAQGWGGNGKSVLFDLVVDLLGDYAGPGAEGLVTSKEGQAPLSAIADLVGLRLVLCSEVQEGHQLNTTVIKKLTGDRRLKDRFLHKQYFEFTSTLKLVLLSNPRPPIRDVTDGTWRRLKLVHFKSRVAEEGEEPTAEHPVRDKALLDTLLADEGSGILALLIEWAGRYAAEGLRSCPAVEAEVRDYRTEVDVLGQFITDQLVPGEGYEYDNTTLYAAYKLWALEMGLHNIWPQSHLTRALKERGFVQRRRNEARYWEGIGPRSTRTE